jgi:choline dehydrogenase-like flavoprotein
MSQGPLAVEWAQVVGPERGLWGIELRNEMAKYNHMAGLKIVGEVLPQEKNRVELTDETDEYGLRIPRVIFSYADEDKKLYGHAVHFMSDALKAAGGRDVWSIGDTAHMVGTCRMGAHPRDSVTNPDGRTWDIANLWICDGSLMPTSLAVNPSLTIQANACRIADRIREMGRRGEL